MRSEPGDPVELRHARVPADLTDGRMTLTVAAVARRLGVAPSTLRTWDRRYGLGPSEHRPGSHRRYTSADVDRLVRMQHALVRGASTVEAARQARSAPGTATPVGVLGLGTAAAVDVMQDVEVSDGRGGTLSLPRAVPEARGLARAALAMDVTAVRAVLREALAVRGVAYLWDDLARPVLAALADRWSRTGAGVEVEHLLGECVRAVVSAHALAAPPPRTTRPVLLACAPGERHSLPFVVLDALLSQEGVDARLLGPDLPGPALAAAVSRTAPAAVVLWALLPATADPAVLAALPRTRPLSRLYAAGPGWGDVVLPQRVGRLHSLAGAAREIAAVVG